MLPVHPEFAQYGWGLDFEGTVQKVYSMFQQVDSIAGSSNNYLFWWPFQRKKNLKSLKYEYYINI